MKKIAILFVLGIFLPALVLGVLALQSASQQGVLIADQEAKLRQQEADNLATRIQLALRIEHEAFVKLVQELLETEDPESVARDFTRILQIRRPGPGLGFSVSTGGQIFSPSSASLAPGSNEEEFIARNSGFLRGRITMEVYPTNSESLADVQQALQLKSGGKTGSILSYRQEEARKQDHTKQEAWARDSVQLDSSLATANTVPGQTQLPASKQQKPQSQASASLGLEGGEEMPAEEAAIRRQDFEKKEAPIMQSLADKRFDRDKDSVLREKAGQAAPAPMKESMGNSALEKDKAADQIESQDFKGALQNKQEMARKVAPQRRQVNSNESEKVKLISNLMVSNSRFADLVTKESSGILSRFVDDRLEIMFWVRPEKRPDIVFGLRILPEEFRNVISRVVEEDIHDKTQVVAAVLDDRAKPFARSDNAFTAKWQQPFVASEVGEVLPHWEVGLYLRDGERLGRTARMTSLAIMGLIVLALGAIAMGGGLVVVDMRRQLALVQKKTDFVSNVSHELKTPLTSIRMFAELLQQNSVPDPEKRSHYLRIITVEAERLTRLINNVLDFARMERNQKVYHKENTDLYEVIRQVWEGQELHLKQQGFRASWQAEPPPYPVFADPDALAQILVNLISNAEKYAGEQKEVELQSYKISGQVRVSVLDRGLGVPAGEENKIFEHFYRAHDSLSSGIQGSGLGLTLAQKIAEEHGGSIVCERRKDGGSRFTLQLPLIKSHSGNTL